MGIHMPRFGLAKGLLRLGFHVSPGAADIPKGHLAVYVGETERRRFVVPVSYLKQPVFQELLSQAEEEFGFDHPILGGLTIPCTEQQFIEVICSLNGS